MWAVLHEGTVMRPVSKLTCSHFSNTTSEGHRRPPSLARAISICHWGFAAAIAFKMSATLT